MKGKLFSYGYKMSMLHGNQDSALALVCEVKLEPSMHGIISIVVGMITQATKPPSPF